MAYTGIAATLLPQGTTVHSAFKVPLKIDESSTCNISAQDFQAQIIKQASVILWDEASMAPNKMIRCVDKLLRDLMNRNDIFFGGKVVVFGGDFRQILPVVINTWLTKIDTDRVGYPILGVLLPARLTQSHAAQATLLAHT